jgi:hypothetical protein
MELGENELRILALLQVTGDTGVSTDSFERRFGAKHHQVMTEALLNLRDAGFVSEAKDEKRGGFRLKITTSGVAALKSAGAIPTVCPFCSGWGILKISNPEPPLSQLRLNPDGTITRDEPRDWESTLKLACPECRLYYYVEIEFKNKEVYEYSMLKTSPYDLKNMKAVEPVKVFFSKGKWYIRDGNIVREYDVSTGRLRGPG